MSESFKLRPDRVMGRYALELRETGEHIGEVQRTWPVREISMWNAFDASGEWIKGCPTRPEAEQAVITRWREKGGTP